MMITADKLSNAEYHAHDAISSSDVKMVHKSTLAHWKAKVYKSSTVRHAASLKARRSLT